MHKKLEFGLCVTRLGNHNMESNQTL